MTMIHAGFDWIIPLIFIVVAVLQIFGKSKKIASGETPPPEKIGGEWDNLLEALGQKTKKTETPVVPPPPIIQKVSKPAVQVPPPQTAQLEQRHDIFEVNQTVEVEGKKTALSSDKKQISQPVKTILAEPVKIVLQRKQSILATLKNRHSIRDAILLNEILSPPVALRN